jgi:DNA polymerase III subunit gamma/tau
MDKKKEHVALYRKWRSQKFSEVIGQEHICTTLRNVLRNRHLMFHAYLFCGPKGTGKTSMARIYAKALNCLEEAPGEEPCNRCANCIKITEGSSIDVMEIDAASNTSVDMVRQHIIDKVNFAPMEGALKIYIIDEVHKLSDAAFNALLKTLEEPPSHVIFIFATTHPHELLPTILSRCQRFDFRRISPQDIIIRMRAIAQTEGYQVEEGALGIIANASEGSLRDALVILEQAISFSEGEVTTENVTSLLGLTEESTLFNFSQLIGEGKISTALHLLDELVREGKDIFQFVRELLEHYRKLLIVGACKDAHLIVEAGRDTYERLQKNAGIYDAGELMRVVKILSDLAIELKDSVNERVTLEIALIKMASKKLDPSLNALKLRLDSLEKRIFGKKIEESERKEIIGDDSRELPREEPAPPVSEEGEKEQEPGEAHGLWDLWPKILQAIKNEKMPLYAVLVDTKPRMTSQEKVVIEVKKGFTFHKEQVEHNRAFIAAIISQFFHRAITLEVAMSDDPEGHNELFKIDYEEDHKKLVKDAMNIFGGRVI